MNTALTASIARILKPDHSTAGAGFVVSAGALIVSCAHVIESAGAGPGECVTVVLCDGGERRQAWVEPAWWRDPGAEDLCVLTLSEPLPKNTQPLPLASAWGSEGHRFVTFGFPAAGSTEGLWGAGEVLGMTTIKGVPILQLRSPEVSSGFSGAPVWDQDSQCVIGIVTAIAAPDRYARQSQTAFATPTDVLLHVCPDLERVMQRFDLDAVRVYVSPVSTEFAEFRRQLVDRMREKRYTVLPLEPHAVIDDHSSAGLPSGMASCHIYVGILALARALIARGQEPSSVATEYRQACDLGLQRLMFLFNDDPAWAHGLGERDAVRQSLAALGIELADSDLAGFFADPDDLRRQVTTVVDAWALSRLDTRIDQLRARRAEADRARRAVRDRQRIVNLRPLDVGHTFKDRLRETHTLYDHLSQRGVRLIAIVGRGGMGKTALVSHVLADLEEGILPGSPEARPLAVDGIIYLSARTTGLGLDRIYADVGRMLGEPAAGQLAAYWGKSNTSLQSKVEYLLEMLQDGLYLVLLDNLESYLDKDGNISEEGLQLFIEHCLTQPSGTRLVVTSREEIKIAAAAFPSVRCIPLYDGLPIDDAVALLKDLDPEGRLGLRDASEQELRRAARLTSGIPRALEILAGILHEDPAASLTGLLASEAGLGSEMLERLVAEGYRRLGADEQRVMEGLAVLDRQVSETAIAYVLHPWFPGLSVRASLRRLTRSYFVNVKRSTGEYGLHPLDRDEAYHQIPEDDTPDGYTRRNLELRAAEFYLSMRKPEREWHTLDDIAPQLAEFEHRIRADSFDDAALVLTTVSDRLSLWGHYDRLRVMCEQVLGRLSALERETIILEVLIRVFHSVGKAEEALGNLKKLDVLAAQIQDRQAQFNAAYRMGVLVRNLGQPEQALEHFRQALAIATEIGSLYTRGKTLEEMGVAYRDSGQIEIGIACLDESLAVARAVSDQKLETDCLTNLGMSYLMQGRRAEAIDSLRQGLEKARAINYPRFEGWSLEFLGRALLSDGDHPGAEVHLRQALEVQHSIGNRNGERQAHDGLAEICLHRGDLEGATRHLQEALDLDRQLKNRHEEDRHLAVLGTLCAQRDDYRGALGYFQDGWRLAREMADKPKEAYYATLLGSLSLSLGNRGQALVHLRAAHSLFASLGDLEACRRVAGLLGEIGHHP
jgi:tetratricopeptide (TPR) repeat protein